VPYNGIHERATHLVEPAVTPAPGYALGFSQPLSAFSKSEFLGFVSRPNRS